MNETPICPACGSLELSMCEPWGFKLYCRCRACGMDFYAPLPPDDSAAPACDWTPTAADRLTA